jgi:hypothetical protein
MAQVFPQENYLYQMNGWQLLYNWRKNESFHKSVQNVAVFFCHFLCEYAKGFGWH